MSDRWNAIENELKFSTSRSSGPGGQNANKVESRVTIRFNIINSSFLDHREKTRIRNKLRRQINSEGEIVLSSDSNRSQLANKKEIQKRLIKRLKSALIKPKKRIPTKPGKKAREKRLQEKKKQSEKKNNRNWGK